MRQPPNPFRLSEEAFAPNPGRLRMRTYVPETLEAGAGLVVVLHGCTQSAADYAGHAGWIALSDRFGFALVCPEQTRENNPNLCFNWFRPGDVTHGAGEAASIAAMVRAAVSRLKTDPTRVFVTGLSAGGAMAGVVTAAYPELFAGAALIAGLPYGVATGVQDAFAVMAGERSGQAAALGDRVRRSGGQASAWPPVAIWQGQADTVVRPAAGEAVARQWRDVHRVQDRPRRARTPDGREFEVWLSASGEPVVEVHRIAGMGHGTPIKTSGRGACGSAAPYLLDVGVSSSFESALAWGLADPARPEVRRPSAADTGSSAPDQQVASGVQTVIEQALRRAGLMG